MILPWPPSNNHYWGKRVVPARPKPFVKVYIAKAGKQFRKDVQDAVWQQCGTVRPTDERLTVSIVSRAPNNRKHDLDNLLKATLDALTHAGVWSDDSHIDRLTMERGPVDRPHGRLDVTIETIPEARLF